MKSFRLSPRIIFALLACFVLITNAQAQVITLERPGERDFIVDRADLMTADDEQRIRQISDKLLTDTASPIIVVTIESMSRYTQRNISSIESFAKILFDQWGIGHLTIDGQPANTGILFLVSRDDRKARIELGIGWDYEKEAATQRIMNEVVVPRFRAGDFSGGIVAGVQALDQMARQGPASMTDGAGPPIGAVRSRGSPSASSGGGGSLIGCGGFGLVGIIIVVFIVMRLLGSVLSGFGGGGYGSRRYRRYRRGPGFGTGLLGGILLGNMMGGRRSSSSSSWGGGFGGGGGGRGWGGGGGFSGGSFGGGFSGGRGASGSW